MYVTRAMSAKKQSSAAGASSPRPLTPRQKEVLELLTEGRTIKEIAVLLHVSSRTVEFHKYTLMKSLGVRSPAELGAYAVKHGLVA
jgi:DNA-binding NarL/FixJ family response regulator